METVSAESNWRLTLRRSEAGVTILSAQTCDERAVLPAQVLGIPVTELAHHALAAGRGNRGRALPTSPTSFPANWT